MNKKNAIGSMLILSMVRPKEGDVLRLFREKIKEKRKEVEAKGGTFTARTEYGQRYKDENDEWKMSGMGKDGIFAFGHKLCLYYEVSYPESVTSEETQVTQETQSTETSNEPKPIDKMTVPELTEYITSKGGKPEGNKPALIEIAKSL